MINLAFGIVVFVGVALLLRIAYSLGRTDGVNWREVGVRKHEKDE